MTITIKSNPDGVTGAIQVNGVDKVTIGASGITAGSFAPNSIDAAAAALAFSGANQSLATSGYQKLPSGLILQWGSFGSINDGTTTIVTFPISFPSACVFATAIKSEAGGSDPDGFSINARTAANMTVQYQDSGTAASNSNIWFAIGY